MSAFALPADAHPLIRQGYEYWLQVHPAENLLPGRQHVDPTAIPKLLSHIWMVDVQAEPLRFRYRLLGTAVRRITPSGEAVVGRWIDEVDTNFIASGRMEAFVQPVRNRAPCYRRGKPMFPLGLDHLTVERLFMPLAADGKIVDMLFCISLFLSTEQALMDPSE
ncbi:PAS domain-containing protein [Ferrovibrio terrae]|uniref:PAS domain-containing protein n=1 Tax=Ferrovibrio terrae TaxID=2594003 RepID=UPI003138195A